MSRIRERQIWKSGDSVLVIQAHPDDAEYFIGGTIAKMVTEGCTVSYVTITDGSKGTFDINADPKTLSETRKKEQRAAADVLGVSELFFLDYPDGDLYPSLELREKLIKIIRTTKPNIVMALDAWLPYEAHPDHRVAGLMASEATVFAGMPNFYKEQVLSGLKPHTPEKMLLFATYSPNVFIDITKFLEKKVDAIMKHESQLSLSFPNFVKEGNLEEVRKELRRIVRRESKKGKKYVESLKMFRVGAGHFY
ncbi:PIG-L family deacetylase [archaeon]|nr:PIG-L family deacetylase [archaeon]